MKKEEENSEEAGGEKTVVLPELSDMMAGREEPEAHAFYCHFFLPCVVGRTKWNYMMRNHKTIDSVATSSDEALGLVLLENSWNRWSWEHTKTKEEIKIDYAKKNEDTGKPPDYVHRGARTEGHQPQMFGLDQPRHD